MLREEVLNERNVFYHIQEKLVQDIVQYFDNTNAIEYTRTKGE